MITLKHITIERFRLLRSMNLHFPQRGSILIQGPNEAGKSALLESIYFALYGEPLTVSRGKRSLDDLILYGAANALVTLTLSVGTTEIEIARTIVRGLGQQVSLQVRRLGLPDEEPITSVSEANQRIISELEQMNGETVRNTCLIEQKGLTRLEKISGKEREATVRKLLGLEKLEDLAERFQVMPEDEERLKECQERLRLAEMQARIPQLSEQLATIEAALDAVKVAESLQKIEQQETEISEQEQALEAIHTRRLELKSQMGRVQQLKRADNTLATIISSYEEIAEARTRLPELEKEIAELERREREELPKLETRVNELAELTRSFGTLQRMSNDLLTAVDTIKDLEQELKHYQEAQQDLRVLNEQVAHARSRLAKAQQAWQELEERRSTTRPLLEDRLQRLHMLRESLTNLQQLEDQYTRLVSSKTQAEESEVQLQKVQKDLQETEQELTLVEREARQAQQRADTLERLWRQLSIRRQVEEWQRLKGLAQGLAQAQQHVSQAIEHQGKLSQAKLNAKAAATKSMLIISGCAILAFICLIVAITNLGHAAVLAILALLVFFGLLAFAWVNLQQYRKARAEESIAIRQEQEAQGRYQMMVTAREAAMRMAGNPDSLLQVENEIRSLGGTPPRSLEEAQQFLEQTKDQGDLGEIQQQMKERLAEANAARNQVNVTMEAVAALRKERAQLEDLRRREHWEELEENLRNTQSSVELLQQEVTLLAGQENMPMASINVRLQKSPIASPFNFSSGSLMPVTSEEDFSGIPELETIVESTIKATERELAALDGKLDLATDLASQTRIHQEALDVLLIRQQALQERQAEWQKNSPEAQIERAREQQAALRSALQSLQDSLRQRVKPLGVMFGQAAISSAETTARKQLEELQITLGNKIMLQERHAHFTRVLKERQESLSEHYKQLAKFSNTLGSWIVPLNPFAEALVSLRTRCQRELEEANEPNILKELDTLQNQESAAKMKIELCRQEIAQEQAAITAMLVQRKRPQAKSFEQADLVAVWPLLGEYSVQDRTHLEEERDAAEQELDSLEKQELELSTQLNTGNEPLDLEETRVHMEQQRRSYETKKHGNQLLKEVDQRLLRKILPRTEHYMQQILPLLTGGRYHDVHLVTDDEEGTVSGGAYQIQVWDSGAGEYVPSSALSGGAADQLSLALRLAFAIAVLPRELSAAPGFVILDEPLSSFDRGRTQALVDVVTGEILSQHFEQVILVSHSSAFDPAMFPYHVYMDNGQVIESNLPVVPRFPTFSLNETGEMLVPVAVGAGVETNSQE